MSELIIPAIVTDYAKKLSDKNLNVWTRDNYMKQLMNIRNYCDEQIRRYEKHRIVDSSDLIAVKGRR